MTLRCDNHPEREAWNCSGWAVKRYLCEECRAAWTKPSQRQAARDGKTDWADRNEPFWGWTGEYHSYTNPNAEYARRRDQHTIDRSKE